MSHVSQCRQMILTFRRSMSLTFCSNWTRGSRLIYTLLSVHANLWATWIMHSPRNSEVQEEVQLLVDQDLLTIILNLIPWICLTNLYGHWGGFSSRMKDTPSMRQSKARDTSIFCSNRSFLIKNTSFLTLNLRWVKTRFSS